MYSSSNVIYISINHIFKIKPQRLEKRQTDLFLFACIIQMEPNLHINSTLEKQRLQLIDNKIYTLLMHTLKSTNSCTSYAWFCCRTYNHYKLFPLRHSGYPLPTSRCSLFASNVRLFIYLVPIYVARVVPFSIQCRCIAEWSIGLIFYWSVV